MIYAKQLGDALDSVLFPKTPWQGFVEEATKKAGEMGMAERVRIDGPLDALVVGSVTISRLGVELMPAHLRAKVLDDAMARLVGVRHD